MLRITHVTHTFITGAHRTYMLHREEGTVQSLFTRTPPHLPSKKLKNKNLSTVTTLFRHLIDSLRTAHNAKNHTTKINFLTINFNWVLWVQRSTISPQTYTQIFTKHRMEPQVINTINSKLHNKAMRTRRGDAAASV
jgi:hypothetical protein